MAKMYSDRRVIHLLQEICVAEANGKIRFLTGSKIGVSAHVQWKIGPKLALCCEIAKIVAVNMTVFKPDKNFILSADCNKTANKKT